MKSGSLIAIGFAVTLLQATVVTVAGAEPGRSAQTVRAQDAPTPPVPPQNALEREETKVLETRSLGDLQAAADRGEPDAQWKLGGLCAYGVGVARSDVEALKWFRRAADQGSSNAQVSLGVMYDKGKGVERDQAEALQWYQKAADQGNANGQYNLGLMYLEGAGTSQDYSRAMLWFGTAAQQGDADAQDALGDMFLFGKGVAESDAEAIRWYRKAADQGLASAQASLGFIYEFSESLPDNLEEGVRWYRLAADQGNAEGQYRLGLLYRDGRGVPQDNIQAYQWFSRAAANSDTAYREDSTKELFAVSRELPARTVLNPPLLSEPFKLILERWLIWFGKALGYGLAAWMTVAMLIGVGMILREKMQSVGARRKAAAQAQSSAHRE
jgi:TPR repeat protein